MNKQEAIEKIKNIETLHINDIIAGQQVDMVIKNQVIDIISQIDEPQKPVIPKFVAEWLDTLDEHGLFCLDYDIVDESVLDWVYENYDCNAKKLHLAYLYGYEIEKEKLYTVEIPDPNSIYKHRFLRRNSNGICLDASNDIDWKQRRGNRHTEAEIKQDFEWAWKWAKEVEDDEV